MKQARRWLSTVPVLLLLVTVVAHGTAEKLHAQLLKIGEENWPGYATMRTDPARPECDPESYGKQAAEEPEGDPLLEELIEDSGGDEAEGAAAEGADEGAAEGDEDALLEDLVGVEESSSGPSEEAIKAAKEACQARHDDYESRLARLTPGLERFRWFETSLASGVELGVTYMRHLLVLLLLFGAITATTLRMHIALRPPKSALDGRVSQMGQLIANGLLLASAYTHWRIDVSSGIAIQNPSLPILWIAGFSLMALINIAFLVRPPVEASDTGKPGSIGRALLSVPLYASMAMISGLYFLLAEGHPSGLAIYLQKLTEHAMLYIYVGLYVFVGMLLKGTRLARLSFDIVRPWRLPPELLAVIVVVVAAFPTAYSGASGIFVMATAAIIYEELRRAGARKGLALAATAMSGGFGVVLRPCLLVVIVASLNKQVTTDEIYLWGGRIFAITAAALVLGSLVTARRGLGKIAPIREALPASLGVLKGLLPYVIIGALVLAAYAFGMDTGVDEHTAPTVLPVLLLFLLIYDRRAAKRDVSPADTPPATYGGVLLTASSETSGQIGALLMLMSVSVCLGGVVERGDLMSALPASMGSPALTMALLVLVLVVIGMTMDPYGAVILVSASIAQLAYDNGIDPLHFWLTVLVAFELGYLTPPVALNHLLVRQVVDVDAEPDDPESRATFWRRHERTLLPVAIMGLRLLIVAFLPFLW